MSKGELITFAITYGGAAISFVRPLYGLCAYIMLAILKPEVLWKWSVVPGNYSRTVGIALLASWILYGTGNWQVRRGGWVALSFVGFLVVALLSSSQAPVPEIALGYIDIVVKIVLPFIAGLTLVNTVQDLRVLTWTIGLSAGYLGIVENEVYFSQGVPIGDNQTAHTLAAATAFCFFVGLDSKAWWSKGMFMLLSAACFHGVLFHMSRGAMLGLATAGVMTFLVLPKTPYFYGVMILAALGAARMAGQSVIEEFSTMFNKVEDLDDSATSRFEFWKAMWEATLSSPILGVGPRNWPIVSYQYGIKGREGHNMWLQLLCETGFTGFFCIAVFYGYTVICLLPVAMGFGGKEQAEYRGFAQMVVVSLCTWATCEVFGSFYAVELPYYIVLVGAATLKLMPVPVKKPVAKAAPQRSPAPPAPSFAVPQQ